MEFITEGNYIYQVQQVGSATIKTFSGYVVPPELPAAEPDRIAELEQQVRELTVMLGDLVLDGGV